MIRVVRKLALVSLLLLPLLMAIGAEKAPSVNVQTIDGQTVALDTMLIKGPTIVDFWATWCTPCKEALPGLDELYGKYKTRGLQVFAVAVDGPKTMSKVQPYVIGEGYNFTVYLDPSNDALKAFGGKSVPHTVLVNQKGEVVYTKFGNLPGDEAMLEKEIEKLLPEKEDKK